MARAQDTPEVVRSEKKMESARRLFDYDQTLREFRRACAQHGIDPLEGASGYQVVHVIAERHEREWQPDRWWQRHEIWTDCPPYRSSTEADAIWNLFREAYLRVVARVAEAVRLRKAHKAFRNTERRRGRGGSA